MRAPVYYERWFDGRYRWFEAPWNGRYVEIDGSRRAVNLLRLSWRGFVNVKGTVTCTPEAIEAGVELYQIAEVGSNGSRCLSAHASLAEATNVFEPEAPPGSTDKIG